MTESNRHIQAVPEEPVVRYFLYGLCSCPEPTEHEVSKADYEAAVEKWAQGCESVNGFKGWTAKGEFRGRIQREPQTTLVDTGSMFVRVPKEQP